MVILLIEKEKIERGICFWSRKIKSTLDMFHLRQTSLNIKCEFGSMIAQKEDGVRDIIFEVVNIAKGRKM